jgi:hypothetical protein
MICAPAALFAPSCWQYAVRHAHQFIVFIRCEPLAQCMPGNSTQPTIPSQCPYSPAQAWYYYSCPYCAAARTCSDCQSITESGADTCGWCTSAPNGVNGGACFGLDPATNHVRPPATCANGQLYNRTDRCPAVRTLFPSAVHLPPHVLT